ncbi:alpha/beta hydrolase family esterase [Myceligenerans indicum]|uniref:Xaa-Pro dipeptidyl-peptidase-like domain-containing protein n=1 Tax=Myceligenerans indicum TaxID=2593663 RepID=A0ABS1LQH3_9MICO|nr:CocE/NonD family hydrolase [Myceligenerans indicum]MBL0888485.1 hypothetical protein [Myceligenerans indicum]
MRPLRSTLAALLPVLAAGVLGLAGCSSTAGDGGATDASSRSAAGPDGESVTVELTGGEFDGRSYEVVVPAGVDEPFPVILALHPHGGNASQARAAFGLDGPAAAQGFATVYPSGPGESWNAGDCCGEAAEEDRDDVGFLEAVVDDLAGRFDVDTDRVYVTGFSNGAMMTYRLACESDVAAAIAPVSGVVVTDCPDPLPLPVLHIHGKADDVVPADGSEGSGGLVPRLSAARSAELLAGDQEHEVVLLDGIDHSWPDARRTDGAYDAPQEIVAFFAALP